MAHHHTQPVRPCSPVRSGKSTDTDDMQVRIQLYRSPLLWLPCELLVHTASYLSPGDLFSLRLTCHRAETSLFKTFSEEFFSSRRFMVSECLGCLMDISKHPHLSKCLTKLTIGLDRLYSSDALPNFGRRDWGADNPRVKTGIEPYKLEELAAEQNWLVSSGRLQLLLGEALGSLPNVVELSLRDAHAVRERRRPGSSGLIVSYGTAEVCRLTGVDFRIEGSHLHLQDQFADVVFSAALLAVARSGRRLGAVVADIQKQDMGLSSSAFVIPKSLLAPLRPTLQSLRSLDLSVSFTYVPLGSFTRGSLGFLRWQPHYLFWFLERTPNLVNLRVRSKGHSFMLDGVIEWLARSVAADLASEATGEKAERSHAYGDISASLERVALSDRFRFLRDLELGNMIAPRESVSKVLLYFAGSLRRLRLDMVGVTVFPGDDELDNDSRSPNAWTAMFREMSGSAVSLEDLRISCLGHHNVTCTGSANRHQVAFLRSEVGAQSGPPDGLLNAWSHARSSPPMEDFLLEVAEKTVIICTRCKQRNGGYRSFEDVFGE